MHNPPRSHWVATFAFMKSCLGQVTLRRVFITWLCTSLQDFWGLVKLLVCLIWSGLGLMHPSSFRHNAWALIIDLFSLCWWISYKQTSPNKLYLFILMDSSVMPLSDTLIIKWKWQKRRPLIICLHWTTYMSNTLFIYDMCDQHNYLPFAEKWHHE